VTLFGVDDAPSAAPAVIAGPSVRVALIVAYAGAGFHGFAAQPKQRTVAGVLGAALERHLRHAVELTCAGRTDAGVHAWGQVVTFDARADVDLVAMQRAVNRALRPAVVVRSAAMVDAGFDARRSATARRYRYTVLNRAVPDPFLAATSWHVASPLDLAAMRLACDPLYGEHDFSSFCRRPAASTGGRAGGGAGGSLVRRVSYADWSDRGDEVLCFEIEASSFCQQMVRAVVGTLVEIGAGKRRAGEMAGILRARDRSAAGQLAPPGGLCLWEVRYPS
jgi:tRNA pseudouridine38-40 synthase